MARSLRADARREHTLVAWVVMQDPPAYPDRFVARLATNAPTPYMLVADTLAGFQAQLPPAARSGAVRACPFLPERIKELCQFASLLSAK